MAKPIHPSPVNIKTGHTLYLITSDGEPLPNGKLKVKVQTIRVGSCNAKMPTLGERADILPVNFIRDQLLNRQKRFNWKVKDSLFFSKRRALARVEGINRC